jgi:hypothetical protein
MTGLLAMRELATASMHHGIERLIVSDDSPHFQLCDDAFHGSSHQIHAHC